MLNENYTLFAFDENIRNSFSFTPNSMKIKNSGKIINSTKIQCLQSTCNVGFFLVDFNFMDVKKYTKFVWSVKFVEGGVGCCEQIGVAYTSNVKAPDFHFNSTTDENLFGIGMYSGEIFTENKILQSNNAFKLRPGDEVEFFFNKIEATLTI